MDNIGITVPNMEQAIAFFVDVLGCELLYEREPPGDDSPRDRLGFPAGSRIQGVRFLTVRPDVGSPRRPILR